MLAANIIFKLAMGISCFDGQIPIGDSKISLPSLPSHCPWFWMWEFRVMEWPYREWCYVDLSVSSNKVQKKGSQGLDTGASFHWSESDYRPRLSWEWDCPVSLWSPLLLWFLFLVSLQDVFCQNVCGFSEYEVLPLRKLMARSTHSPWRMMFCYK